MSVCQLYCPGTAITDVGELRWWLFSKRQMQDCKLPPTVAALEEPMIRANYQTMIWNNDITAMPDLPTPFSHGWKQDADSNEIKPIRTSLPAAPDAVVHLVRCQCKSTGCSKNCSCRHANLYCTDMCLCGGNEDLCNNINNEVILTDGSDEDDEDEDNNLKL